ncbi:MAG: Qat anti-phage system TatD family nuclease QatD [Bacteroidota bacterium]|nr:Qat anti-phage system TatD family nuclease QatD [Bacteroidota bacterium]
MLLHDTHFHLDLFPNPEEMVSIIEKAKIYTIAVTNSPSVFFYTKRITSASKYIKPALGLHPELASQRKKEIKQFLELIDETRYIGEIGLDNLNKTSDDYLIQKQIFETILRACADKRNKILTIHSRKASKDVISMIGNNYPGKVILHWYSGGAKELEKAIKNGYYFSINYSMTISESGKKIIEQIPIERILIETDGPFTVFSEKPSTPELSEQIFVNIKRIKKVTYDFLSPNFKSLISNFQFESDKNKL